MAFNTLAALRRANANETPILEMRHFYVRLLNGQWMRTLDAPPKGAVQIRGRVYKMVPEKG